MIALVGGSTVLESGTFISVPVNNSFTGYSDISNPFLAQPQGTLIARAPVWNAQVLGILSAYSGNPALILYVRVLAKFTAILVQQNGGPLVSLASANANSYYSNSEVAGYYYWNGAAVLTGTSTVTYSIIL